MLKYLLAVCCVVSVFAINAQSPKNRVVSIPVERNGITLREPWVGGTNAPQFSSYDINQDGIKDLFIYDREGDKILTYLGNNTGGDTTYDYAPRYEELFPAGLLSWAVLRDYNKDGVPDLFTFSSGGVKVYKGSIQNARLHFDVVSPQVHYTDGTDHPKVFANYVDMPVFTDVNGDGDIDVLSYGQFGATVEYYENQTKEHPGDPHYDIDSFQYVEVTQCWGNFAQDAQSNSIQLNAPCKGGGEAAPTSADERHAGNSIYSFDADNDHDVDLLNGNIGYNNLIFIQNCGDSVIADACHIDSIYPLCDVPIIMASYPAAYGVDINNDGLEDLLIAPNESPYARDVKNVEYYKNTGNAACLFQYQNDSFLVHHMLDLGTDSKAVFYDVDGDGLKDIIVGNYGYFRPNAIYNSTLAFYRNTGTATQPKFTEQTTNYANMSMYSKIAVNPAFGDLDGDGKPDMIIGDLNGDLQFFKNTAATGSAYPVMTTPLFDTLHVNQYSAPFIFDVNGDSLNDLVVGQLNGRLAYYWNFGTKTSPRFSPDSVNAYFGNVNVAVSPSVEGYSSPFLMRDATGNIKLYVGTKLGAVYEYDVDPAKLRSGSFNRITTDFLGHDVGSKATISIADINNDGKSEYLIGNSRGGLLLYSDSAWNPETTLGIEEIPFNNSTLLIYPNPANDYFTCTAPNIEFIKPQTELYNLLGEKITTDIKLTDNKIIITSTQLTTGFYIIRITDGETTYSGKVLITK